MAVRPILHYPDPRLRQKAREVKCFTPEIEQLIVDLFDTMHEAHGVGLAAPQLGELHRVFVVGPLAFVNPQILKQEGSVTGTEGCLSLPGKVVCVERSYRLVVRALDRHGISFEMETTGFLSVAIQHENDHLDGVLMHERNAQMA